MNIDTGEIMSKEECEKLDKKAQARFVELEKEEAEELLKVEPNKRYKTYENDVRRKNNQVKKRREANRRNKQSSKRKR